MWKPALAVGMAVLATAAFAQSRPSTLTMSCAAAAGLVASRGAAVLSTGPYTYARFVRDGAYCEYTETTEPAFVPAADTSRCAIGYTCRERFRSRP